MLVLKVLRIVLGYHNNDHLPIRPLLMATACARLIAVIVYLMGLGMLPLQALNPVLQRLATHGIIVFGPQKDVGLVGNFPEGFLDRLRSLLL